MTEDYKPENYDYKKRLKRNDEIIKDLTDQIMMVFDLLLEEREKQTGQMPVHDIAEIFVKAVAGVAKRAANSDQIRRQFLTDIVDEAWSESLDALDIKVVGEDD